MTFYRLRYVYLNAHSAATKLAHGSYVLFALILKINIACECTRACVHKDMQ